MLTIFHLIRQVYRALYRLDHHFLFIILGELPALNIRSLLNKVPRVPLVSKCPSAWVLQWPSTLRVPKSPWVPKCLSVQVLRKPECPTALRVSERLECPSAPSALRVPKRPSALRVPECPKYQVPWMLECPSSVLSARDLEYLECPSASVSQLFSQLVSQLAYHAGSVS